MFARRTSPCGRLREATMASKSRRSSAVSSSDDFGRPMPMSIPQELRKITLGHKSRVFSVMFHDPEKFSVDRDEKAKAELAEKKQIQR